MYRTCLCCFPTSEENGHNSVLRVFFVVIFVRHFLFEHCRVCPNHSYSSEPDSVSAIGAAIELINKAKYQPARFTSHTNSTRDHSRQVYNLKQQYWSTFQSHSTLIWLWTDTIDQNAIHTQAKSVAYIDEIRMHELCHTHYPHSLHYLSIQ